MSANVPNTAGLPPALCGDGSQCDGLQLEDQQERHQHYAEELD